MDARRRYLPKVKNISTFPFFTMKVVDLKAWQLYIGQSTFVIVMGIVFFAILEFLRILGVDNNSVVSKATEGLKSIATGNVNADTGASVMNSIMSM